MGSWRDRRPSLREARRREIGRDHHMLMCMRPRFVKLKVISSSPNPADVTEHEPSSMSTTTRVRPTLARALSIRAPRTPHINNAEIGCHWDISPPLMTVDAPGATRRGASSTRSRFRHLRLVPLDDRRHHSSSLCQSEKGGDKEGENEPSRASSHTTEDHPNPAHAMTGCEPLAGSRCNPSEYEGRQSEDRRRRK